MPTKKKEQAVESLQQIFSKCDIGVLTDYRGLKTTEINELRSKLRDANIDYKVVKNSLAQIAAKNAGLDHIIGKFEGPLAVAFGYGEPTKTAKALADYIRVSKSTLSIKAGFLPDMILSAAEVDTLARLPSREVLLSKVIGGMKSPIYGLVNVLAGPIRGMMGVLQARIQQLEGQ
ncbi:MAG: 50S ribosomal protein L10 [Chloroflexi bacterium RBG_13_51_52]|nr:MAG: 50S ribosomal protein L10 [Chloroflexi bacterium RBG_13_51_52]